MTSPLDDVLVKDAPSQVTNPSGASPLDSEINDNSGAQKLSLASNMASKKNPDEAATALKVQSQTGLPMDMVDRNVQDLKGRMTGFNPNQYHENNPKTSEWLSRDPNNFAAAKDDLHNVAQPEQIVKKYGEGKSLLMSLVSGFFGMAHQVSGMPNFFANFQYGLDKAAYAAVFKNSPHMGGGDEEPIPPAVNIKPIETAKNYFDKKSKDFSNQRLEDSVIQQAKNHNYGDAAFSLANKVVSGIPQLLPFLAGPAVGIGTAGLSQASTANEEAMKKGATPEQASNTAIIQGSIAALLNKFGTFSVLKGWSQELIPQIGKVATAKIMQNVGVHLAVGSSKMGAQGFAQSWANDFSDYVTGVNKNAMDGWFQRASENAAVGAGSGLALDSVPALKQFVHQNEALSGSAAYSAFGEAAKNSKLLERHPDGFKQLVEASTKDSPMENIHIPVDAWNKHMEGRGIDPAGAANEMGLSSYYDEAKETGVDMKVPMADWVSKVGKTDHYAALAQDVKFDPSGKTINELAEEEKATQAAPKPSPMDTLKTNVVQKLNDLGFNLKQEEPAKTENNVAENETNGIIKISDEPLKLPEAIKQRIDQRVKEVLNSRASDDDLEGEITQHLDDGYELVIRGKRYFKEGNDVKEQPVASNAEDTGRAEEGNAVQSPEAERSGAEPAGGDRGKLVGLQAQGSSTQPLPGLPESSPGPNEAIRELARKYATDSGIPYREQPAYVKSNADRGARIADAYEKMVHNPDDPKVKAAYGALIKETMAQYQYVKSLGLKIERIKPGQPNPYPNGSSDFLKDIRNGHLWFYPTSEGFGAKGAEEKNHPLLAPTSESIDGQPLLANDVFRIVHDIFGHAKEGVGIGPHGEENAWQSHARMYSPLALKAMTSETRGQNSWVNFGSHAEENRLKPGSFYADQKAGIMPPWTRREGLQDKQDISKRALDLARQSVGAAYNEQGLKRLFPDLESIYKAKDQAENEVYTKVMDEVRRRSSEKWTEQRDKLRTDLAQEIDSRPEQIAKAVLEKGTLPDGSKLPEGMAAIKLDKKALIDKYGEDFVKELPNIYAAKDGLDPEMVAPLFGYKSGDEMIQSIKVAGDRNELADSAADDAMQEIHGEFDPFKDLPDEAMRAIHNDNQTQILRKELEILARDYLPAMKGAIKGLTKKLPTTEEIRADAEKSIADKKVRDINPEEYRQAEKRANKSAVDMFLKGDFNEAYEAKKQELLNLERYRAASNAKDEIDGIVKFMKSFQKQSVRQRIGKAGGDYLDQIDAITDRYNFSRNMSAAAVDRRKSLVAWANQQENLGYENPIPDKVMTELQKVNYKDMVFDDLRGVKATVGWIQHLANIKFKSLADDQKRDFQTRKDEILASIQANHDIKGEPADLAPGFAKRMKNTGDAVAAFHTKMEFMFEHLDGEKNLGPVWDNLFRPTNKAHDAKNEMMRDVSNKLKEVFDSEYTKAERVKWLLNKTFIPEAKTDVMDGNFTHANILSVLLHQGNPYNQEALKAGYKWNDDQVNKILEHATDRDYRLAQKVLDLIDSYWPEIKKQEVELNGVAPEKVEGVPFEHPDGNKLPRGGYMPLIFDSKLSWRQLQLNEKSSVGEMFGGQWARAMTKHGFTQDRTNSGGKPPLLDLTAVSNHLSGVIHDLAWRRTIIDLHRLVNDPDVRSAIEGAAGRDMYKQLNPWLRSMAGDRGQDFANPIEGILSHIRTGATIAGIGLKLTSGLVHGMGYLNVADEIGGKYAARGLSEAFGSPMKINEAWNFVTEKSPMMKNRFEDFDRDIHDATKRLAIAGFGHGAKGAVDAYTHDAQKAYFMFLGMMDRANAFPGWLGAYRKVMDGAHPDIEAGNEKEAIEYADSVIRKTKGSGAAKDLANVQQGNEAFKLFTMFYSPMSVQFNRYAKAINNYKMTKNIPQLVTAASLLWLAPAAIQSVIRGRTPAPDSDSSDWATWLAKTEAAFPFESIIGMRDLTQAIEKKLETGRADFEGSPVFDAFKSMAESTGLLIKPLEGQEVSREEVKAAVMSMGYAFHLPTRQIYQTLAYFHDWAKGDIQPDNTAQGLWEAFVTGHHK